MEPANYADWLTFVFDRPYTEKGWYFEDDVDDYVASEIELAELVTHTMLNCGQDLARFSDGQVSHGLLFIFYNAISNIVFSLMEETVPIASRLKAISSIKTLYSDCLAVCCPPVMGSCDDDYKNSLTYFCYMFWDVTPLNYWENRHNKEVFYDAVLDVMSHALTVDNLACIESALHGLSHTEQDARPGQVKAIVDDFLMRRKDLPDKLCDYAEQAALGRVM